ncbi:MAG: MotA/TolQ/ExbB proton channel family protein, partial [Muribaculaceae bacterium]|nr:MotA/TolQ/ExbB proton channel family protein [Muribaculaceae bacterium]
MDTLSFWSLCMDGGYIMIPLAILLLLTIYVFTERVIVINRALKEDPTFMRRIRDYVHEADLESAARLCKTANTPYSRMILKGLQRIGRPTQDVLSAIDNCGNLEIANLGKGLPRLS